MTPRSAHTLHPVATAKPELTPTESAWVCALHHEAWTVPAGLCTANGSQVAQRFAIYRNNVLSVCVQALADTFPVCLALVGPDFFHAMALSFARSQLPRSRRLAFYGEGFAEFVQGFPPAMSLPYLGDLALLEMARVKAYHAGDAASVSLISLEAAMQDAHNLPTMCLQLHPSLALIGSDFSVLSIWQAHQYDETQRDTSLAEIEVHSAQGVAVFRSHDKVLCLPLTLADLALLRSLQAGQTLGQAIDQATAKAQSTDIDQPGPDISHCLTLLIQHELITDLKKPNPPGGFP